MTTYCARLLDPEEYHKLGELPEGSGLLPTIWPHLRDRATKIVVVERVEEAGAPAIVGVGVLAPVLMGEQLWVAPEARGSRGALPTLLAGLSAVVREAGANAVISHVTDQEIEARLDRHGATQWPGTVWTVPILAPEARE